MEKKKISLNLGGLKLGGSTSSQTHDDPGTSGFGSFGKKEPEKLVKDSFVLPFSQNNFLTNIINLYQTNPAFN